MTLLGSERRALMKPEDNGCAGPPEQRHARADGLWSGKLVPHLALFDVLGRRWALRVIWELRFGPLTFRALQERAASVSSSVLTDRLRELREAGLVDHERAAGYTLTAIGHGVAERVIEMFHWLSAQSDWPPQPPP